MHSALADSLLCGSDLRSLRWHPKPPACSYFVAGAPSVRWALPKYTYEQLAAGPYLFAIIPLTCGKAGVKRTCRFWAVVLVLDHSLSVIHR